jgi:protein-S-isoprenylcysteine O-methyltransferase Ste14
MLWLLISVLLWGFFHSFLAADPVKEIARKRFGNQFRRYYRLFYNLFALTSFVSVLVLAAFTPDDTLYLVPLPWSGMLILGQVLSIIVMIIGFLQKDGKKILGLRQLREIISNTNPVSHEDIVENTLVTTGLYGYVRHPLYAAGIAFLWLMPLMTKTLITINLGLTVYVVIGAILEERKLFKVYGKTYTDYAAVTPMFIPFYKRNKPKGNSSV